MRVPPTTSGRLALLAALAASGGAVSCGGSTDANDEPHVSVLRLQIGGEQITVLATGAIIGQLIVLRVAVPVHVSAAFTDKFGVPDPRVTPEDFRLDMEAIAGTNATFVNDASNALSGTLTPNQTISGATLRVSLYHVSKGHMDWGPFSVGLVFVS